MHGGTFIFSQEGLGVVISITSNLNLNLCDQKLKSVIGQSPAFWHNDLSQFHDLSVGTRSACCVWGEKREWSLRLLSLVLGTFYFC